MSSSVKAVKARTEKHSSSSMEVTEVCITYLMSINQMFMQERERDTTANKIPSQGNVKVNEIS